MITNGDGVKHAVFRGSVAVVAFVVALGVAACGGSTSPSQGAPTTASATPSAISAAAPPAASASASIAGIPFYQPSQVTSQTGGSALLTSPDSVAKVSAFYVNMADSGGWTTVSKSITPYSGNLTIKKSGEGATISISPSGPGSTISISTYPAQ